MDRSNGGATILVSAMKRQESAAVGGAESRERLQKDEKGMQDEFLTEAVGEGHLPIVLQRALDQRSLLAEVASVRQHLQNRYAFQNVLSKNPRMYAIFDLIGRVAQTATTVLIEGETGTGKEQVARAVHQASQARSGPMVPVACAAMPADLLESELFGHEKGAFTNAVSQRKGRFELAHGGTLFLDEIGDMPTVMQAKLLRVLQERHFERVGGNQGIAVDVRVVAATNRCLRKLVRAQKFREDLYYRLNVVKIDLPPLRERAEDIPLLATHFTQKYARPGVSPQQITPDAMELLLCYVWPGNIRQLENAIERACVTSRDGWIRPTNLPPDVLKPPSGKSVLTVDLSRTLGEQVAEITAGFEERYLRKALRKTHGNLTSAAHISGLSRRGITSKLIRYKIDKSEFKNA